MFRKVFIIVLAVASITITACHIINEESDYSLECLVTDIRSPNFVSLSQATDVANSFAKEKGFVLPTRGNVLSIKNTFTVKDRDSSSIVHAINFEGGGFTLVSCDNRIMPILASSDQGNFSFSDSRSPLGLKIWVETVRNMIEEVKSKDKKQEPEIKAAWEKYSSTPINKLKTRSLTPDGWPPPEADTVVGPLITDSWHQFEPYNESLGQFQHYYYLAGALTPSIICRPTIGCVPLTIVRVMKYHQYPSNFNWSIMPDTTPINSTTKNYIRTVHEDVKTFALSIQSNAFMYFKYPNDTTRLTSVLNTVPIGSFMQSQYGYASGEDDDFSSSYYENMRRDLIDHELPCIIRGTDSNSNNGHAWICDGYSYSCVYLNTPIDPDDEQGVLITTYLHHCWGETTTTVDGWYWATDYTLNGVNRRYNMKLTRHISPIDYWPDE